MSRSREELWDDLDQIEMEVKNLRHFVQNDFEKCIEDGIYDRDVVKKDMPKDVKNNIESINSLLEEWKNDFYDLIEDL